MEQDYIIVTSILIILWAFIYFILKSVDIFQTKDDYMEQVYKDIEEHDRVDKYYYDTLMNEVDKDK